jgi:hypothetical protein
MTAPDAAAQFKGPFVVGIVGHGPRAHRPGHDVEVVDGVAGRGRDRVVAARDQHDVAVAHGQRLVERAVGGVHALEREPLRRADAVVVGLLEEGLLGHRVAVVLVRRVARPVPGRREHLADEQRVGRLVGHQDRADRALVRAVAAGLDRDRGAFKHARLRALAGRRAAQPDLGVTVDRVLRAGREVDRVGEAGPRIRPAADGPVAVRRAHRAGAGDDDDAQLVCSGGADERCLRGLEADVRPPGRFRRDGPAHDQAHGASTYCRCDRRARSYSARAARTDSSAATSATGTSHQLS